MNLNRHVLAITVDVYGEPKQLPINSVHADIPAEPGIFMWRAVESWGRHPWGPGASQ